MKFPFSGPAASSTPSRPSPRGAQFPVFTIQSALTTRLISPEDRVPGRLDSALPRFTGPIAAWALPGRYG